MASEATEQHICDTCGEVCKNITELFDHILIVHDKAFDNNDNNNDNDSQDDDGEEDDEEKIIVENTDEIIIGVKNNDDEKDKKNDDDEKDSIEDSIEDNLSETDEVIEPIESIDISDSKEEDDDEKINETITKNRSQLLADLNKLIIGIDDKKYDKGLFVESNPMLRKRVYRKIGFIKPYHPSSSVTNSAPLHSQPADISSVPSLSLTDDKIPTSYYGKYVCPVCSKKYSSPFYMGEHYTLSHNGYEEQLLLDDKKYKTSFAGFDILEVIGMTENVPRKELIALVENTESCPICVRDYKLTDDETDEENIFPIKVKCCGNIVCKSCLKSHCSVTNSIKCPLCTLDHTRVDLDFIKIIDFESPNKQSWLLWKIKHSYIYDC